MDASKNPNKEPPMIGKNVFAFSSLSPVLVCTSVVHSSDMGGSDAVVNSSGVWGTEAIIIASCRH